MFIATAIATCSLGQLSRASLRGVAKRVPALARVGAGMSPPPGGRSHRVIPRHVSFRSGEAGLHYACEPLYRV